MTDRDIRRWCAQHAAEQKALLMRLACMPAPSHHEEKRAAFIMDWLSSRGIAATLDVAGNVVVMINCGDGDRLTLYAAHMDVVFPDTDPLPVHEAGGRLFAPGVGDDTANVAALMLALDFMFSNGVMPSSPCVVSFNVCEEGLGNLKGIKQLMRDHGDQTDRFISFDGTLDHIVNRAVGSERYRVEARTEGGHSYSAFGNRNAIHALSSLICALYTMKAPDFNGGRSTYNVGVISGGTSVNTIAQNASMLFEYRSDDAQCLEFMRGAFTACVNGFAATGVELTYELIGDRPCGVCADRAAQETLDARAIGAISAVTGKTPGTGSGSTDANIPLSLGIPSVVFGLYAGDLAHTREEWVDVSSLTDGLITAISFMLQ